MPRAGLIDQGTRGNRADRSATPPNGLDAALTGAEKVLTERARLYRI
jgi:hypothetical protein